MRTFVGFVGLTALTGVWACGGDGGVATVAEDARVFFAVEDADALAHDALPLPSDLGTGWEVTARDDFDDSGTEEFDALVADEPACSTLSALAGMGGLLGDSDDEVPAGRANIALISAPPGAFTPVEVEFEVTIEETVAEVQGPWKLVKDLMESEDFDDCMIAAMSSGFEEVDLPDEVAMDVTPTNASAEAPNDGITMAFDITMDLGAVQIEMALEMYMWPYGNARASAMFVGDGDTINAGLTGPVLTAFETKLRDAAS